MSGLWSGTGKTLSGVAVLYAVAVGYGSFAPENLFSSSGFERAVRQFARSVSPQLLLASHRDVASHREPAKGPAMPNFHEIPVFSIEFVAGSAVPRGDAFDGFLTALAAVTELPDGAERRTVSISCDRSRQWMTLRVQNPFDVARRDEIRVDFQMVGSRYPAEPGRITFLVRSIWSGRMDAPASQSVVDRVLQFLRPGLLAAAQAAAADAGGLTVT